MVTAVSTMSCGSCKEIAAYAQAMEGQVWINYTRSVLSLWYLFEMTLSLWLKCFSFFPEVLVENPWDKELICKFLSELPKPLSTYTNYFEWKSVLPPIQARAELHLGKSYFKHFILKHLLQTFLKTSELFIFLIQLTYAYIQIVSRLSGLHI